LYFSAKSLKRKEIKISALIFTCLHQLYNNLYLPDYQFISRRLTQIYRKFSQIKLVSFLSNTI